MKKAIIIISALILSLSLSMAQNIQQQVQQQQQATERQEASIREAAERERQEREARERREREAREERERNYQNALASAQQNFAAGQYALARHYYITAREINPESAMRINARIVEIETRIREEAEQLAEAALERRYQDALTAARVNYAQRNFTQAIENYTEAIGIRPENSVQHTARIAAITEALNRPAELRIYRPRPAINLGAVGRFISQQFNILLDDRLIAANTTDAWNTTVEVTTFGTQTLSASIEGRRATLQIDIQPGGIYYILVGTTSRSVETGGTRAVRQRDGSTQNVAETRTEHTPTLQLVSSTIGAAGFRDAVTRRRDR